MCITLFLFVLFSRYKLISNKTGFETSKFLLRVRCVLADGWNLLLVVSRLEERESEMKKEYNALHQRHTEVGCHLMIFK